MQLEPPRTVGNCNCGCLNSWITRPGTSFVFDGVTGEYQFVLNGFSAPLYFCPQCGGRLPSRRNELFTTPSKKEMDEVQAALNGARSIHEVIAALGQADETIPWCDLDLSDEESTSTSQWERAHRYRERWNTFVLDVLELADGSVEYVYAGKYIGPREVWTSQARPWWKFW